MKAWKLLRLAAVAAIGLAGSAQALAEVGEVKMMSQFGIGYMPLTMMKHDKLVEKHLAKAGPAGNRRSRGPGWAPGAAANDALLSGGLHFASGGTGPAIILWDRTRANVRRARRGGAVLDAEHAHHPQPEDQDAQGLHEKDRIAMAGAGSSVQTIYLQMAVAKEFGIDNYKKLNPLMVNLRTPTDCARCCRARTRSPRSSPRRRSRTRRWRTRRSARC